MRSAIAVNRDSAPDVGIFLHLLAGPTILTQQPGCSGSGADVLAESGQELLKELQSKNIEQQWPIYDEGESCASVSLTEEVERAPPFTLDQIVEAKLMPRSSHSRTPQYLLVKLHKDFKFAEGIDKGTWVKFWRTKFKYKEVEKTLRYFAVDNLIQDKRRFGCDFVVFIYDEEEDAWDPCGMMMLGRDRNDKSTVGYMAVTKPVKGKETVCVTFIGPDERLSKDAAYQNACLSVARNVFKEERITAREPAQSTSDRVLKWVAKQLGGLTVPYIKLEEEEED